MILQTTHNVHPFRYCTNYLTTLSVGTNSSWPDENTKVSLQKVQSYLVITILTNTISKLDFKVHFGCLNKVNNHACEDRNGTKSCLYRVQLQCQKVQIFSWVLHYQRTQNFSADLKFNFLDRSGLLWSLCCCWISCRCVSTQFIVFWWGNLLLHRLHLNLKG